MMNSILTQAEDLATGNPLEPGLGLELGQNTFFAVAIVVIIIIAVLYYYLKK